MADQGAVTARYTGPSGHQLFDGTVLNPGDLVEGVGRDEAANSDYWEIVSSPTETAVADVAAIRSDWSFDVEAGGGASGRPGESDPADPVALDPAPEPDPEPEPAHTFMTGLDDGENA